MCVLEQWEQEMRHVSCMQCLFIIHHEMYLYMCIVGAISWTFITLECFNPKEDNGEKGFYKLNKNAIYKITKKFKCYYPNGASAHKGIKYMYIFFKSVLSRRYK